MKNDYVQYGCGFCAPKTWKNFDSSPTLRFERLPVIGKIYTKNIHRFPMDIDYGNIVRGLPVADNACKGVYCSHVLEHLSLCDFRKALSNTYKILRKGGCFRFVLPDLEYSINKYYRDSSSDAALNFLKETGLGKEINDRGLKGLAMEWFGNSQHIWAWDYKSIVQELENKGFRHIRRAVFGDSADTMFNEVEDEGRWKNSLGVECIKP